MRSLSSQGYDTATAIMAGDLVVGAIRYGASTLTLWNMALDENGNPVQSSTGRRGVVTVKSDKSGTITRNPEFYVLSHIGRFVRPGARRCASTTFAVGQGGADVETVAFLNSDGSVVVFLWNAASTIKKVTIVDAVTGLGSPLTLPARAIATVTYGATATVAAGTLAPPGAPSIAATAGAASVTLAITSPASVGDTQIGGYAIYRGTTSGSEAAAPVAILPAGATSFVDAGLTNGTAYFYIARAFGGGGSGAASAEVTATPAAAALTLGALTLSPTTATAGTAFTGTVSGRTSGSTITASSSDGTALAVSGTSITGAFSAAGSPTITLTETLSGATNTPKTSTVGLTVSTAAAAAALVQDAVATGNSGGGSTGYGWNHAVAVDANLLVVALGSTWPPTALPKYPTATAVTAGGVAMTQVEPRPVDEQCPGLNRKVEFWSLSKPADGTPSPSRSPRRSAELANVDPVFGTSVSYKNALSSPFGTVATAGTSSSATSLSVTTTSAKGVVLASARRARQRP